MSQILIYIKDNKPIFLHILQCIRLPKPSLPKVLETVGFLDLVPDYTGEIGNLEINLLYKMLNFEDFFYFLFQIVCLLKKGPFS